MTPEQRFYQQIKSHLPGIFDRVENVACPGMPDINGSFNSDYWIELKVAKSKSYDPFKLLKPSQVSWMYERCDVSRVFLFVKNLNKTFTIFTPVRALGKVPLTFNNLGTHSFPIEANFFKTVFTVY